MKRIIIHALMAIVGATLGNTFLPEFWVLIHQRQFENNAVVNSLIGAIIFLIFSFIFIRLLLNFVEKLTIRLQPSIFQKSHGDFWVV